MKPIGYWLNRTDHAITHYMQDTLGEFGLTRLAWQVLNVIRDGTEVPDTEVHSVLFANAPEEDRLAAVTLVLTDGWAQRPSPDHLALTDDGRTRLVEVAAQVNTFREVSLAGISDDEYRTAVSVLERMTRNLESRT